MKAITVEEAWNLIAEIGWGVKTTNYKAIAAQYFKQLGKAGMEQLEQFVGRRVNELDTAVTNYELRTGKTLECGSDDSFSDLRYHVVGMGQAEFEKAFKDPRKLAKRYASGKYKESFSYCFQEPDPPRTAKQKEETVKELALRTRNLMVSVENLVSLANGLRGELYEVKRIASQVQEDRKKDDEII